MRTDPNYVKATLLKIGFEVHYFSTEYFSTLFKANSCDAFVEEF